MKFRFINRKKGKTADQTGSEKEFNSSNPFSVPGSYFDKLPGEIEQRKEFRIDPESTAANFFKVPDGYFEGLPMAISDRISSESKKQIFVLPRLAVFTRPQVIMIMATALIVIFFSFRFLTHVNPISDQPKELCAEDIRASVIFNELDESLLIEALGENEEVVTDTSGSSEIEQYLLDNHIDQSLLENKL